LALSVWLKVIRRARMSRASHRPTVSLRVSVIRDRIFVSNDISFNHFPLLLYLPCVCPIIYLFYRYFLFFYGRSLRVGDNIGFKIFDLTHPFRKCGVRVCAITTVYRMLVMVSVYQCLRPMLLSGHLVIHYHTFAIRIYALDIAIRNQFPIR
jgi:hypothetical protein